MAKKEYSDGFTLKALANPHSFRYRILLPRGFFGHPYNKDCLWNWDT
jgi:hypothetical protein